MNDCIKSTGMGLFGQMWESAEITVLKDKKENRHCKREKKSKSPFYPYYVPPLNKHTQLHVNSFLFLIHI